MTARHDTGPRRSQSIESYLRRTRLLAIVALLALAGAIVSDVLAGRYWGRHALLAGLAASVIVVMLTVAVINEVVERRRRQRWRVLAQYVMLELVRNARLIWTGVLENAGLLGLDDTRPESVDSNAHLVRDIPRLAAVLREVVADDTRLRGLHREVTLLSAHCDDVLGRWAGVMLNADAYAEVVDRHVELASEISWLESLLDNADPPEDHRRRRRAHTSPAVQIEGRVDGAQLADRVVAITQLAEELDRTTLALAMRIVSLAWWQARLGATVPPQGTTGMLPSSGQPVPRRPS